VASDHEFMRRALGLAAAGWGRVHPNPLVGAVVVRNGRVVGEGWHTEFGEPHAEIMALGAAGERAKQATLYVTLEPCAHRGKTPPCTDAIVAAGIARVVYASPDPNEQARGGASVLAGHGIDVESGLLADEERRLNAAFHFAHEQRRPWVALKLAVSLDAKLAGEPGRRTDVTGPQAWDEVHRLRAGFDALLVGRGTVETDDPLLTVRGPVKPRVPPMRVVLDSHATMPLDARLITTLADARLTVLTGPHAERDRTRELERVGATIQSVPGSSQGIDLEKALSTLWQGGVRSILCEGGARVAAALIEADLVQRIYLFIAPVFFGEAGVPAFPLQATTPHWTLCETRQLGADALLVLDRNPE
jgi:diaminohydroxyphosphoribosylaminopyrimidine deaminase/5-amino-6-(5-phosphoribosylamino)uracil reductase